MYQHNIYVHDNRQATNLQNHVFVFGPRGFLVCDTVDVSIRATSYSRTEWYNVKACDISYWSPAGHEFKSDQLAAKEFNVIHLAKGSSRYMF